MVLNDIHHDRRSAHHEDLVVECIRRKNAIYERGPSEACLSAKESCYDRTLGKSLQVRGFEIQICEISIGSKVLNLMTALGRAKSERVV